MKGRRRRSGGGSNDDTSRPGLLRGGGLGFTTCNCTSWGSAKEELTNNEELAAAVICVQERKLITKGSITAAQAWAERRGWRAEFSPAVRKRKDRMV